MYNQHSDFNPERKTKSSSAHAGTFSRKIAIFAFAILFVLTIVCFLSACTGYSDWLIIYQVNEQSLSPSIDNDPTPVCYVISNGDSYYSTTANRTYYTDLDGALKSVYGNGSADSIIVIPGTNPSITSAAKQSTTDSAVTIEEADSLYIPYTGIDSVIGTNLKSDEEYGIRQWGSGTATNDLSKFTCTSCVTLETNLTVIGTIKIGAVVSTSNHPYQGFIQGDYAKLDINGNSLKIDGAYSLVESNGVLSDSAANSTAQVELLNGAELVTDFCVEDFYGGTNCSNKFSVGESPFMLYKLPYLMCDVKITYGCKLSANCVLYASGGFNYTKASIFGTDGLIEITSEDGYFIHKLNDSSIADYKEEIDIYADIKTNAMSIVVSIVSISTASVHFPISKYLNFCIYDDSAVEVNSKLKILPGCTVNVYGSSTITINSEVTMYDDMPTYKSGLLYPDYGTASDGTAYAPGQLVVHGNSMISVADTSGSSAKLSGRIYFDSTATKIDQIESALKKTTACGYEITTHEGANDSSLTYYSYLATKKTNLKIYCDTTDGTDVTTEYAIDSSSVKLLLQRFDYYTYAYTYDGDSLTGFNMIADGNTLSDGSDKIVGTRTYDTTSGWSVWTVLSDDTNVAPATTTSCTDDIENLLLSNVDPAELYLYRTDTRRFSEAAQDATTHTYVVDDDKYILYDESMLLVTLYTSDYTTKSDNIYIDSNQNLYCYGGEVTAAVDDDGNYIGTASPAWYIGVFYEKETVFSVSTVMSFARVKENGNTVWTRAGGYDIYYHLMRGYDSSKSSWGSSYAALYIGNDANSCYFLSDGTLYNVISQKAITIYGTDGYAVGNDLVAEYNETPYAYIDEQWHLCSGYDAVRKIATYSGLTYVLVYYDDNDKIYESGELDVRQYVSCTICDTTASGGYYVAELSSSFTANDVEYEYAFLGNKKDDNSLDSLYWSYGRVVEETYGVYEPKIYFSSAVGEVYSAATSGTDTSGNTIYYFIRSNNAKSLYGNASVQYVLANSKASEINGYVYNKQIGCGSSTISLFEGALTFSTLGFKDSGVYAIRVAVTEEAYDSSDYTIKNLVLYDKLDEDVQKLVDYCDDFYYLTGTVECFYSTTYFIFTATKDPSIRYMRVNLGVYGVNDSKISKITGSEADLKKTFFRLYSMKTVGYDGLDYILFNIISDTNCVSYYCFIYKYDFYYYNYTYNTVPPLTNVYNIGVVRDSDSTAPATALAALEAACGVTYTNGDKDLDTDNTPKKIFIIQNTSYAPYLISYDTDGDEDGNAVLVSQSDTPGLYTQCASNSSSDRVATSDEAEYVYSKNVFQYDSDKQAWIKVIETDDGNVYKYIKYNNDKTVKTAQTYTVKVSDSVTLKLKRGTYTLIKGYFVKEEGGSEKSDACTIYFRDESGNTYKLDSGIWKKDESSSSS